MYKTINIYTLKENIHSIDVTPHRPTNNSKMTMYKKMTLLNECRMKENKKCSLNIEIV